MDAVKLKILEENLSEYLEQAKKASQHQKYNAAEFEEILSQHTISYTKMNALIQI